MTVRSPLLPVIALSIATLATDLPAQRDSSRLLAGDLSSQNTVSTNQFVTPLRALKAVQRARNHFIAGRVSQAQKEISYALDVYPRCALALNVQGAIHLQAGNLEDAVEDFQRAIGADPALGSAHLGLAMSLIARNRFEEAVAPLDRATSLLPGSWLVYFETAITRLGHGDPDAALKQTNYAERFSQRDPERESAAAYVRGVAYIRLRNHDSAKKYLEDAVAFDPGGAYATVARNRLEQLGSLFK